jgi:hypothetical protein
MIAVTWAGILPFLNVIFTADSPSTPFFMRPCPLLRLTLILAAITTTVTTPAAAQSRVGRDSSTRVARYGHDVLFGTALGFVYAGVDQLRNDPVEWGRGWRGYEKRVASDVGEFVVQETATDILATVMNRPLDYQRCRCRATGGRAAWAVVSAVADPTPDGGHVLAVPRIVGAFAGSFAQAAWRPATGTNRAQVGLVNGATSLLIGAGINLYYEFRHR